MQRNHSYFKPLQSDLRAQVQEVAVHASSLWDGFVFQRDSDELFRIWGQGGIELHCRMAELAMRDVQLGEALFQAVDASFPGVYTYEVTEALGQMVAGHLVSTGNFPTEPEWQTTLGELALEFFEHGSLSQDEMSGLREVVARQLPHWQSGPSPNPFDAPPHHIPIKPPPDGVHSQATT